MKSAQERLKKRHFIAFAACETIEAAWTRSKQLVDTGRPMILIERWLSDVGDLRVFQPLRLNDVGFRPGAYRWTDDDQAGFSFTFTGVTHAIAFAALAHHGSEAAAIERFHAKRDATRIDIEGDGRGRDDYIRVTSWNDRGVGLERSVYFQFEDASQRAEREGAFLDTLATHGDWSVNRLATLAEAVRYFQEPALDLVATAAGETATELGEDPR